MENGGGLEKIAGVLNAQHENTEAKDLSRTIVFFFAMGIIAYLIYLYMTTKYRSFTFTNRVVEESNEYMDLTKQELAYALMRLHRAEQRLKEYADFDVPLKISQIANLVNKDDDTELNLKTFVY